MYVLKDTWGAPQCGCEIKKFDSWGALNEYIEYIEGLPQRLAEGYATIQEEEEIMKTLICDWKTKGNLVRLYCCDEDQYCDVWGDDWDDVPYEHNAGQVYDRYVSCIIDLYFGWDIVILEAENDWEYNGNSPFSKQMFKDGKAPIFIAYRPHKNDYWDGSEYHQLIGGKNTNRIFKFYMGDNVYATVAELNKKVLPHMEVKVIDK